MGPIACGLAALNLLGCIAPAFVAALPTDSNSDSEVLISVNSHVKHQELDGFGTSQAFQRAEDILGKDSLSQKGTQHVLDLLFSKDIGAGFSILRNGIGSSNSATCTSGDWKQAYADYLLQWVKFYRQSGIKVTNLGFLNEPQFAASYAGMLSDGTQAANFIRVLGKTIQKRGIHDLSIACCDGEGWDLVVTGHGYVSPPNHPLSTTKKTWLTEWADLTGHFTPYTFYNNSGQGEGMTWAGRIQTALVDANVSGFLYWIGAENSTTNSALINMIGDKVIPSKRFWAFASFSRFARPGARRIEATSSVPLITVSSFLNTDGTVATQVLNNDTVARNVKLVVSGTGRTLHSLKPFLTDNSNDLTALGHLKATGQGSFQTTIPPRSLVSFVTSS
ncbi:cellulose hydrolase [Fusarium circinatum]|uniref:Cellulose hydrolase n=1 Tax=Fusarium circinatum TaxID=48490 RepID=A0A8H5SR41_FUSCI|nr:cellulose hydrolase [Fusarium circinatum]